MLQSAGQEAQKRRKGRGWCNARRGHGTRMRDDGEGEEATTVHGRERQWRVAVAELQREITPPSRGADKKERQQEAEAEGRASWLMWCHKRQRGNQLGQMIG
jgi:hypothetical protein